MSLGGALSSSTVDEATAVVESSTLTKAAGIIVDPEYFQRLGTDADGLDGKASFLTLIFSQLLYGKVITDVGVIRAEEMGAKTASEILSQSGVTFEQMPQFEGLRDLAASIVRTMIEDHHRSPGDWDNHIRNVPENYGHGMGWSYFMFYEVAQHIQEVVEQALEQRPPGDLPTIRGIEASAMYVLRGVLYASRAYSIQADSNLPASYVASPHRLQAISRYINHDDLARNQRINAEYAKTIEKFPMPRDGYNLSILSTDVNPILHSRVSRFFLGMPPGEAIETALRLRDRDDVRLLRKSWAMNIQRIGSGFCEEATTTQAVYDSDVGTLNQTVVNKYYVLASHGSDPAMASTDAKDLREAESSFVEAVSKDTSTRKGGWWSWLR